MDAATSSKLKITVHANASLFKGPEIKRAVQSAQAWIPKHVVLVGQPENFHCAGRGHLGALCVFLIFDLMLVFDKLSPHLRRILDVTCLLIAAAFTHESWEFKEMATGLVVITIWPAQSTYVNGCWLLLAATVDELVTLPQGGKHSYRRALKERHAKGDFSSDI